MIYMHWMLITQYIDGIESVNVNWNPLAQYQWEVNNIPKVVTQYVHADSKDP